MSGLSTEVEEKAVDFGDVLVFPLTSKSEITVNWSQRLKKHTEIYYVIAATNSTRGNTGVNMYVQKDIYDSQFTSFATVDGENGKATITDKFQYGQKGANDTNRFVVLHDTDHKLFGHRFLEATLQSQLGEYAESIAANMGYSTVVDTPNNVANSTIGEYLKAFKPKA